MTVELGQNAFAKHADTIKRATNLLQNVRHGKGRLGPRAARDAIEQWLNNFLLLEDRDLDFPAKLLDALSFLPDSHIQDCFSTIAADFLDRPTTFIVPLGEPSESSFRLSAAYHRHPGFRTSLPAALDEILAAEVQPTILFFDDFLNSGGQLTSIMHSWLGVPLPPGAIADEGDKRTRLSSEQVLALRSSQLHFMFYCALQEGLSAVRDVARELGLRLEVTSHTVSRESVGAFGTPVDIECIELNAAGVLAGQSPFSGFTFSELHPFYCLLQSIGHQLLLGANPHWPSTKARDRALGYGHSAKLWIGESNVPTCTITPLWLGGLIAVEGREVHWQPLLPRRKKLLRPLSVGAARLEGVRKSWSYKRALYGVRADFFGRSKELTALNRALCDQSVALCCLLGSHGVGKTYLWRAAITGPEPAFTRDVESFVLVDCRGVRDVVGRLVDELELGVGESPERSVLTHLQSHNTLIVLENVQHQLDELGRLRDPILDRFLAGVTDVFGGALVLAVSTQAVHLRETYQHDRMREIEIDEGLSLAEGVALLRSLGVTASRGYLEKLVGRVKGLPGALVQSSAVLKLAGESPELPGAIDEILATSARQLFDSLRRLEKAVVRIVSLARYPLPISALGLMLSEENHASLLTAFRNLSTHFLLVEFEDSNRVMELHESLREACVTLSSPQELSQTHGRLRVYYSNLAQQWESEPRSLVEAIHHAIESGEVSWARDTLKTVAEVRLYRQGLIRECASLFERIGHVVDDPELDLLHGLVEQTRGHFGEAAALYRRVLGGSAPVELRCRAMHQLASIRRMTGDMAESIVLFIDNCQLARENGLEEATARSLYQMAIWKRETGQISEAIEHLSEARDIYEKRSSARGVAKVDIQRAKIEILVGQGAIAVSLLVDAERRGSEVHDPEVVAAAQHQLGNVHHYQSHFATAERHYDRSRVIRGDLGDVRGVAAILHQLAFMALKQRRFDAARQLVLESQKLWSSVDNIQGRALNDSLCFALCWIEGHHDEAIKHYASAERVFTRIGDSLNLARLEALASGHIDTATIHMRPDGGLNVLQRLAPGEVPFTLSSFLADSEGGAK